MERYEDISNDLFILNSITVERLFQLGTNAFALYSFYYKTSKWQKTSSVWATNDYVAQKLDWGRDKVIKVKKILEDNGFIKQERIVDESGKTKSWNIRLLYVQNDSTPLKTRSVDSENQAKTTPLKKPPVEKSDTYIYNNKISNSSLLSNNSNKSPYPPLQSIETDFEEFWKAYTPVKTDGRVVDKGSKKMALAKYKIARRHATKQEIMEGLQRYIQHCIQNRILTCGVPVFLNQERWKNEYGPSAISLTPKQQAQQQNLIALQNFLNSED